MGNAIVCPGRSAYVGDLGARYASGARGLSDSVIQMASSHLWGLGAAVLVMVPLAFWAWGRRPGRASRHWAREVAAGRYEGALGFLLSEHRYADAAAIEEARGQPLRAAEHLERAGDLAGAGAMYRLGTKHKLAAMAFRDAGEGFEAAESYRAAGDFSRAHSLYEAAGATRQAALCLEGLGRPAEAALSFEQCEDWAGAARAHWNAHDLPGAANALAKAGDFVRLGRLWAQAGEGVKAVAALGNVLEDALLFRPAWILKVQLEEKLREVDAARMSYERLVAYDEARGEHDLHTRDWLLRLAQADVGEGEHDEALGRFERLEDLSLMTSTLELRVGHLREVISEARPEEIKEMVAALQLPTDERYRFLGEVGRGGYGVIYRVYDERLDRVLAMKLIQAANVTQTMALESFLREARTAARLNHPNIVTVYDLGVIEDQPYIAMEFVEGETLVSRLKPPGTLPLSVDALEPLVRGLADALQYAHGQGVVHLDIKLENVMFTRAGQVKLMDFGLARAIRDAHGEEVICGSPLYMAPEQIVGGDLDHRTDIYAFGVMLYLLCSGKWPTSREMALQEHLHREAPNPCEDNPKLTPEAGRVIRRCLAKDPEERYARIENVATELLAALQGV